MNRRNFIVLGSIAGAGVTLPGMARASAGRGTDVRLPNLIFTASDPGHWAAQENLHVPQTETTGGVLKVTPPHPMSEPHYIVSHTVVLEGNRFLSRKTFHWQDEPVSEHKLPKGCRGKVFVTSTCNQHAFWVRETRI